jgi:hypothetical protein
MEQEDAHRLPAETPESWNEHEQATAEADRTIKLKDGDSVGIHIVSGPLTYREYYHDNGKDEKGQAKKKTRIAIPFGAQIPGFAFKTKYVCEVILTDGKGKGQHKLFEFGKTIADQLQKVKDSSWKSTRACDLTVSRKGAGMNDTEYFVTATPATYPAEGNPVEFNLQGEARFSTKEDIDKLPKPQAMAEGSTSEKVSPKQYDFVESLCKQKELTIKALAGILDRKFSKQELSELTGAEASVLIKTLQEM